MSKEVEKKEDEKKGIELKKVKKSIEPDAQKLKTITRRKSALEKKTRAYRWSMFRSGSLVVCGILSLIYYVGCVVYGGLGLSWGWIWLLLGIYLLIRAIMITRVRTGKNKIRIPKILSILYYVCVLAFLVIFTITEVQVISGMKHEPQPNLDYIIVLGAGVRGTTPTRPLLLRMEKAYLYLMDNPNTVVIASGGQGPDEGISEAMCIRNYLIERGISEDRILLEEQSTSTDENISNSYAMIPNKNANVGIVTSGFHIYRSLMIANGQGHNNISGIPARTLLPVGIHYVVREFFAIIKYRICGA